MGWWPWSSPPKDSSNTVVPQPTSSPEQIPQNAPPPKKLTPDEQADLEFKQILASLQEAEESSSKTVQSSSSNDADTTTLAKPTSSIAPESLYADEMSCRTAFDYAFFCQSFGGQFVNVYRYGELRSCSEHWDNFWLCMKTRQWSDNLRKKAIRAHNQKKAIKYKTGPSSEDIWDIRHDPVRDAFQGDFAALEREIKAEEENKQNASA